MPSLLALRRKSSKKTLIQGRSINPRDLYLVFSLANCPVEISPKKQILAQDRVPVHFVPLWASLPILAVFLYINQERRLAVLAS